MDGQQLMADIYSLLSARQFPGDRRHGGKLANVRSASWGALTHWRARILSSTSLRFAPKAPFPRQAKRRGRRRDSADAEVFRRRSVSARALGESAGRPACGLVATARTIPRFAVSFVLGPAGLRWGWSNPGPRLPRRARFSKPIWADPPSAAAPMTSRRRLRRCRASPADSDITSSRRYLRRSHGSGSKRSSSRRRAALFCSCLATHGCDYVSWPLRPITNIRRRAFSVVRQKPLQAAAIPAKAISSRSSSDH